MISDVGRALRTLLRPQLPAAAGIELAAPAPDAVPPASGAVHLVLGWVRDDPNGRQSGVEDVRADDGSLIGRQAPARRYELRYLVTARADTAETEHELLDAVLVAVTGLDALPTDCLPKSLADCGLPVRLQVCSDQATGASTDPAAHAAFGLLISAPLLPPLQTELAPPAAELSIGVRRGPRPGSGAGAGAGAGAAPAGPGSAPGARADGRRWRKARIDEG